MSNKMKIQVTGFEVIKKEIELTLLEEQVSYWELRKYCSPYNTQLVRVVKKDNCYELVTMQHAYGEYQIYIRKVYFTQHVNDKYEIKGNEFQHLNEGFGKTLFNNEGEYKTGCVDIKKVSKEEFDNFLSEVLKIENEI